MPRHKLFRKDFQKENAPKSSRKEVVETKQNTGFINLASGVDDYMLTDQSHVWMNLTTFPPVSKRDTYFTFGPCTRSHPRLD
jgi:hypothetical protein